MAASSQACFSRPLPLLLLYAIHALPFFRRNMNLVLLISFSYRVSSLVPTKSISFSFHFNSWAIVYALVHVLRQWAIRLVYRWRKLSSMLSFWIREKNTESSLRSAKIGKILSASCSIVVPELWLHWYVWIAFTAMLAWGRSLRLQGRSKRKIGQKFFIDKNNFAFIRF